MPKARLFDPRRKDGSFPFDYVPSHKTDVKATIERAKREQTEKPQPVIRKLPDRRR